MNQVSLLHPTSSRSISINLCLSTALWLEDDDPQLFKRFVRWIYTDSFLEGDEADNGYVADEVILGLHVMAEKWDISELHDITIDEIIEHLYFDVYSIELTQKTWKSTPSHSKYRRLLMDAYIHGHSLFGILGEYQDFESIFKVYNPDFFFKFVKCQAMLRASKQKVHCSDPLKCKHGRCKRYHLHEPGSASCEYAIDNPTLECAERKKH